MMFFANKCTGCGKCKEKCPNDLESCELCGKCTLYCPQDAREICGKEYSSDEILREVLKDRAFYENSDGGVTFSGGECMLQIDFLEEMLKKCKQNGIQTAVDTAGHLPYEYFERIAPHTDLFLYDVKCWDSEKHKQYTGVGNELILENLSKLQRLGANIWIRIPVIKGVNDSVKEMKNICTFLDQNGGVKKVELLPYHKLGDNKKKALGLEIRDNFETPTKDELCVLKEIFGK